MFFAAPIHLMFVTHHEIVEDLEKDARDRKSIDIDDIKQVYTDSKVKMDEKSS
jgi:hypothetical protein